MLFIITCLFELTFTHHCKKYVTSGSGSSAGITKRCAICEDGYKLPLCSSCAEGYKQDGDSCKPICIDDCDYCQNPKTCRRCNHPFEGDYCENA